MTLKTFNLAKLTSDQGSLDNGDRDGYTYCKDVRTYAITYFDSSILETPTISQSGQLTTTLKSTPMISASFVMQIDLKIVINSVTQKARTAKVTVQITNECQTTSFSFDTSTVFPAINH